MTSRGDGLLALPSQQAVHRAQVVPHPQRRNHESGSCGHYGNSILLETGVTSPTRFLDVGDEERDRIFEVNVRGSYLVTKRVAPAWPSSGSPPCPHSAAAECPAESRTPPRRRHCSAFPARSHGNSAPSGVTVNSVAPGVVDTDITAGKLPEARKAAMIADIPMGRTPAVHDVADVITFLCRPESSYLTGVICDINGGSHIH